MVTQVEHLPLRLRAKLGYGIGNMGLLVATNSAIAYLLYLYSDVVALSPLLVGVALTVPTRPGPGISLDEDVARRVTREDLGSFD